MLSEEKAFSLQWKVDVDDTKLTSAVDTLEGCSTQHQSPARKSDLEET